MLNFLIETVSAAIVYQNLISMSNVARRLHRALLVPSIDCELGIDLIHSHMICL